MVDVKEAVKVAAQYVADMESWPYDSGANADITAALSDMDFAVEGTSFDESKDEWIIEFGFVRPWDKAKSPLAGVAASVPSKRTYKNVYVSDSDGSVVRYGDSRDN